MIRVIQLVIILTYIVTILVLMQVKHVLTDSSWSGYGTIIMIDNDARPDLLELRDELCKHSGKANVICTTYKIR